MAKPIIALVGRPNVGKSTLFNRLIGRREAIVEDLPGTTRDRRYGETDWRDRELIVVDTGGIEMDGDQPLSGVIRGQAQTAIDEADAIVLVVDAVEGVTESDQMVADMLRKTSKPVFLAVNKVDSAKRELDAIQFYELGLDDPNIISAYHGSGIGDLLDNVWAALPPLIEADEDDDEAGVRVALVGRPNVGKSQLLNTLLGENRSIVSEIPGTTRDTVDTRLEVEGVPYLLVDTAGIRRRGKIEHGVEQYSVIRTLRAIDRCDVAVQLIDATEPFAAQDLHVAGYVLESGRGLAVAINKWDLIESKAEARLEFERLAREKFDFAHFAPLLFISALTGRGVHRILPLTTTIAESRQLRVTTGQLNKLVEDAVASHNLPSDRGVRLKIFFATQAGVAPPTFVFFVNDPKLVHFSYRRFLENRIREQFSFVGTPIRLVFRSRSESD